MAHTMLRKGQYGRTNNVMGAYKSDRSKEDCSMPDLVCQNNSYLEVTTGSLILKTSIQPERKTSDIVPVVARSAEAFVKAHYKIAAKVPTLILLGNIELFLIFKPPIDQLKTV